MGFQIDPVTMANRAGFTTPALDAKPLHLMTATAFSSWLDQQPGQVRAWAEQHHFRCEPGSLLTVPGAEGIALAVIGIDDGTDPNAYAHAPMALPSQSRWSLAHSVQQDMQHALHLGWGLGSYRFSRYTKVGSAPALLAERVDPQISAIVSACYHVRDWINTPAEDFGPETLSDLVQSIAQAYAGDFRSITGDALLRENFPSIYAVGRSSHRAPRLLQLDWGRSDHPHLILIGKGVCFDTGGLDLKPPDGMRNMKKDMGGGAYALALATLVMSQQLPVRLTVLIPAVDNCLGPDALRPGDIVATRAGLHVEIDNTDAEGRLILADALHFASAQQPDLILDFATLTGAARIALGPDLPALFSPNDALAHAWLDAGVLTHDPIWRLPLWQPYRRYLTSHVADCANAGSRMAGAITAALYLQQFVAPNTPWGHLDVYGWNDSPRPGHPAGGDSMGLRSAWQVIRDRYSK